MVIFLQQPTLRSEREHLRKLLSPMGRHDREWSECDRLLHQQLHKLCVCLRDTHLHQRHALRFVHIQFMLGACYLSHSNSNVDTHRRDMFRLFGHRTCQRTVTDNYRQRRLCDRNAHHHL